MFISHFCLRSLLQTDTPPQDEGPGSWGKQRSPFSGPTTMCFCYTAHQYNKLFSGCSLAHRMGEGQGEGKDGD